ncbi:MAG: hypothetical protein H0U57_01120 [Tatlockia sp.]|nr:hypothetical protein [Tatlockia sp.]
MQSKSGTLEELKKFLLQTSTYKLAKNTYCFKNKCCEYTNQLFEEIKNFTQTLRVSVNHGEHWFLLANTSDYGVVILDPTYYQIIEVKSEDYPFFVGSREQLWKLAKDNNSLVWFDYRWPHLARVIYPGDVANDEMKEIFNTDGYSQVKIGNEINKKTIEEKENQGKSPNFFSKPKIESETKPENESKNNFDSKK